MRHEAWKQSIHYLKDHDTVLQISHRNGTDLIDLVFHSTEEPYNESQTVSVPKSHFDCA